MTTSAPDFTPGYPSSGKLIGPAWAKCWSLLTADAFTDRRELRAPVCEEHPIQASTLDRMLLTATNLGYLEVRFVEGSKKFPEYRIVSPQPDPELAAARAQYQIFERAAERMRTAGWTVTAPPAP